MQSISKNSNLFKKFLKMKKDSLINLNREFSSENHTAPQEETKEASKKVVNQLVDSIMILYKLIEDLVQKNEE